MQTIGERLEEARKRKGVSIREVAEATKIRGDYLHKFENNQFDLSLPEIYVRGFLRTYATFLKLPSDKIINDYKGLGIGESKTRGLARESFGRMELSVSSAKSTNRDVPPPPPTNADTVPEATPAPDNNPATFRPRASGPQIDQALVIKGLLALAGIGVLIVLIVVLVKLFSSDPSKPATASGSNSSVVAPRPGEAVITVFAMDNVFLTVRQLNDNLVLFSGAMSRGDSRVLPYRTALRIEADPHRAVELEINGIRYPMPDRAADLKAPASRSTTPSGR
ncbi:MAG TPA: helix-turn-helix domain-containing protein [Opitutaceae bacterium]|nr:helix-turn-helix domain-containing protein [Opitutaceae bacterium]